MVTRSLISKHLQYKDIDNNITMINNYKVYML